MLSVAAKRKAVDSAPVAGGEMKVGGDVSALFDMVR